MEQYQKWRALGLTGRTNLKTTDLQILGSYLLIVSFEGKIYVCGNRSQLLENGIDSFEGDSPIFFMVNGKLC